MPLAHSRGSRKGRAAIPRPGSQRRAKIARPAVPRAYRRHRLFRVLDQARRRHAAAWLGAPAGAGKTTLIASYVEARNLACLWYEVDSGLARGQRAEARPAPREEIVTPLGGAGGSPAWPLAP
jgi:hypothetical protein